MDITHCGDEIGGGGIGYRVVVLGVRDTSRVAAVEYEEGTFAGSAVDSIVVREFSERQPVGPVVLSVINEDSEIFLDFLVNPFGLAVRLRMPGRRKRSE